MDLMTTLEDGPGPPTPKKVSIFDVLATSEGGSSGGLLAVKDDNFEELCTAFCTNDPVVKSAVMNLDFDFRQSQRFASSLLAGHSLIDERSLRTDFAFRTDRPSHDDPLALAAEFCVPLDQDAELELRTILEGQVVDELDQSQIALERYLLDVLKNDAAYISGNMSAMAALTIGDYTARYLTDVDFDCQGALGIGDDGSRAPLAGYDMRNLRAVVGLNQE